MIKPTVGRVVWFYPAPGRFYPAPGHSFARKDDQPLAAHIAYVWSDHLVNLLVIDHDGRVAACASVPLNQGDEHDQPVPYCTWMPYQKGQAAKAEQLEEKLKAG